jgi:aldehyde:ferredoxin oxidoreductase
LLFPIATSGDSLYDVFKARFGFFNEEHQEVEMKFIRINMTDKTIKSEDVPEDYMGLGGRGLTSIMINAEVPPTCDPLGPDNKLIFAPGLLSGTPLVNTSRLSVGAKAL